MAMGEVPFGYAAKVEPGNAWAFQTIWFDAVANQVTAQLVAKWKDRLGGVDTFTHDTVIAAIISISTDAPKHMHYAEGMDSLPKNFAACLFLRQAACRGRSWRIKKEEDDEHYDH